MSLFNHLHLEGNISSVSSETLPDGTIVYSFRLAVEREGEKKRDFINLKAFASAENDPWADYMRGMDCHFDCTVKSAESASGAVENVIVCLNAFPLPTKRTRALVDSLDTDESGR